MKNTNHWAIGMGLFFIAVSGLFLLLNWTRLPPQLPWLYSQPWGEGQLVPRLWFGLGLLSLLLMTLVNLMITGGVEKRDRVVARVIEGATLLLILIYLASFFRVVLMMI